MRGAACAGGPIALPHAPSSTARAGASLRATVLPPNEAHGLREVVGELRQLGRAVGELGNRLELLRRRGGHGLGLRGRRLSARSEEHTSELQSQSNLVCRLLLEKKKHTSTCIL